MKDLMTPTEKAREAKHQQICSEFVTLKDQHPGARPNRIIAMVALHQGMSVPGVTNVLKAKGLYQRIRK